MSIALVALSALTLLGAARAEQHPAPEHAGSASMMAGRATGGVVVEHGHSELIAGGGVAAERALAPGWGLEGTAGMLVGHDLAEVPLELVLERSVELGRLEPYLGAGPALILAMHPGGVPSEVRVGGVGVVGTRRWLSDRWGVLLELDLTASYHEDWAFGAEAIAGVGLRWD